MTSVEDIEICTFLELISRQDCMTISNSSVRYPTFLGIGAQKSGTTWLHSVLEQHPDLVLPRSKETHFFEDKRYFSRGTDWYLNQFPCEQTGMRGEITPGYLWVAPPEENLEFEFNPFRTRTPERIRELLGKELKLIVMLRNPVDRAISAYVHHASKGRFDPSSEDLSWFGRFGIAHMGYYYAHISRWLEVFPKERFRIYCFEDVRANKTAFYRSVFEFLGVQNLEVVRDDEQMQRFATYTRTTDGVHVREIFAKKLKLRPGDMIVSSNNIKYLRNLYQEDVMCLKDLGLCDLSCWKSDFPDLV